MTARPHRIDLLLIGVVIAGALARVWGLWFGLPHTWARPDEDAVMVPAVRVVGGALNPHWFQYPSLYMYALAVPYAVVYGWARFTWRVATTPQLEAYYFAHPALFHLVNRGLSALLGMLTIYLVYRVALLLFTRDVALYSAVLLAVAPLHVRDSHFGTTDVAAAFMTLIAFWQVARARQDVSRPSWTAAGILCGLAGSTKYNAILIVVAALVALAIGPGGKRPSLVVLFGASVLAGFAAGTPYSLLATSEWLEGVRAVTEHVRQGHGLDLGPGWSYHLLVSLRFGMGLLALVAALAGAIWMAIRMPGTAALLLAFPVTYFVATGWSRTVFFRYILPIVPFLCLTVGFGVERLIAWLADAVRSGDTARRALKVAIPAIIIASPLVTVINMDRLLARTDTRVLAADWMRQTFSSNPTRVFQSGAFYAHLQFGARSPFVEVEYDGATQKFTANGQPIESTPDVIVMPSSPLMYTDASPLITGLIAREYRAAIEFRGHDPSSWAASTFDRLDAFFLPIAGFDGVTRPGPNVTIYVKRAQ